jgi:hypothetical protein
MTMFPEWHQVGSWFAVEVDGPLIVNRNGLVGCLASLPGRALTETAPWYHYIPLKADYSDLYDIMAFYVGPTDDEGNVDATKGHDVSRSLGLSVI